MSTNNGNRAKSNRLVEFMNGKGFYIILIVCIAAVGISGYVLFFAGSHGGSNVDMMAAPAVTPSTIAPPSITPVPSVTPSSTPLVTEVPSGALHSGEVVMSTKSKPDDAEPVAAKADLSPTVQPTAKPTASFFVWPLGGEVMVPFSVDELVFSNTMEDWRVHTGADIAGSLGTLVSAVGAGVVDDVYTDEMMGRTVVIDHGNSTYSVYKNLLDTVKVQPGDRVDAGQVIGAVGDTAEAECADSPHLHLEVIRSGAQIDPLTLLP